MAERARKYRKKGSSGSSAGSRSGGSAGKRSRGSSRGAVKEYVIVNNLPPLRGLDTELGDFTDAELLKGTDTNGACDVLNLVQTGNGSWNRNGRKISLKSVRIRGTFMTSIAAQATTGVIAEQVIRMVVVWDAQPSGNAIPTFDTIFGRTVQDSTESCKFLDSLRYDNTDRFRVLRDCVYNVGTTFHNAEGGTLDENHIRTPFDEFIDLKNRTTVFSGQSAPMTIADISSGALYVYYRALHHNGETPGPDASAITTSVGSHSYARLRYYDA
jgi:hypothetical protein